MTDNEFNEIKERLQDARDTIVDDERTITRLQRELADAKLAAARAKADKRTRNGQRRSVGADEERQHEPVTSNHAFGR